MKTIKRGLIFLAPFIAMLGLSGQALADVANGTIVTFDNGTNFKNDGNGNINPIVGNMDSAIFPAGGETYQENGVSHSAIGFGTTPGNSIGVASGGGSHVHGTTFDPFGLNNRVSQLEADAGGGLFQLNDRDPFEMHAFEILGLETRNVGTVPLEFSDVVLRGYRQDVFNGGDVNDFIEVTLDGQQLLADWNAAAAGGGADHALEIDVVGLSGDFSNIYLFEYWLGGANGPGRGNDPAADSKWQGLIIEIDNAEFNNATVVPIPAAVYLFGTGLVGLLSIGRRKQLGVLTA